MDTEKFINSFKGLRAKRVIQYCEKKEGWFKPEPLLETITKEAKEVIGGVSQGAPDRTRMVVKYMIKIGYLQADPIKGLKRNPDFVPFNQKDILKPV